MDKIIADRLTQCLTTNSDKIRALYAAGFERADIARYLSIRYQNVRNVLVNSGVGSPKLRKVPITNVLIDTPVLKASELLASGFVEAGRWLLQDDKILLSDKCPTKPAVYAFVENDIVMYVGVASKSVFQRFQHYINPGPTQLTNIRLKDVIIEKLRSKTDIHIFLAHPENSNWNGMPVDMVAGLEAGIIAKYKPAWNKRGK